MLEYPDIAVARVIQLAAAMVIFFLGLVWFLWEIYLATVSLRIGVH